MKTKEMVIFAISGPLVCPACRIVGAGKAPFPRELPRLVVESNKACLGIYEMILVGVKICGDVTQ